MLKVKVNMRYQLTALALCALALGAACNSTVTTENTSAPVNSTSTVTSTNTAVPATAPPNNVPPISAAHGGTTAPMTAGAPTAGANEKPEGVDTAALDGKITKLEAKVKAGGAPDTDKQALAAVYLERANVYRDAGSPRLYKFALGDYRHVLRYDPANTEAQAKMNEIVSIYNSMGRPVPTNGLEP